MRVKFYNEVFKKQASYFFGFSFFKPTKVRNIKFPSEIRFCYIFGMCGVVFGKAKESK